MGKQNSKYPMIVSEKRFTFRPYQHWFENGVELKKCRECGEAKTLSEYTKEKNTKDRLYSQCRDCKNRIWRQGYLRRKAMGQNKR